MKYFLLVLLISLNCYAANYDEAVGGSITYHLFNPDNISSRFSNKLDSSGQTISNGLLGFRQVEVNRYDEVYTSRMIFTGVNSIAEPIVGALWSSGCTVGFGRIGLVAGLYMENNDKMLDRGIKPIISSPGWGPMPVVGIEAIQTMYISQQAYLLFNSLLTPVLLNVAVGIGWKI